MKSILLSLEIYKSCVLPEQDIEKGKNMDKVSKLFNIDQKSLIDVYEQILSQADEFIMFLTGFIG